MYMGGWDWGWNHVSIQNRGSPVAAQWQPSSSPVVVQWQSSVSVSGCDTAAVSGWVLLPRLS